MSKARQKRSAASHSWDAIRAQASVVSDSYALFPGDAADVLTGLPAYSINTCLTSPPYWGVRDYGHADQLGLEQELDDYVDSIVQVFRQVKRVLTIDGSAWLNLGDRYFHGAGTVKGKPPERGWKRNKQLCLVPYRVALALQEDGWWLRNTAVWHKPNAMPSSVRDRLTNTWEPVFLLTRSERYYFDLDAIRVPHATDDVIERVRAEAGANGKAKGKKELRRWLNSPRHRATIEGKREIIRRPNSPESIELATYLQAAIEQQGVTIGWVARRLGLPFERTRHYFRTDRIGSRLPPPEVWNQLKAILNLDATFDEAMATEVGDNVFRNHPNGRNPGDMVSIGLAGVSSAHFAMMPMRLAEWALKATLPKGGICLDPFMGTGTTGLAAIRQGGRFVGVDVREDFFPEFVARITAR